ncbi:GntR family transcriptional regulator [Neobacillus sp. 3P2-tot-E-2]|uniref:GntR family transcriptional regulator n=1 Tax=Neobacillus sp. 3P2-tot-E-2 TaxID=3132212 RepID=UPI00399F7D82
MLLNDSINKESPLPLYYQLKELIKKEIEEGKLTPGEMIPSERDLGERFEISRPTVRQAINELVNEGILNRKKGLGTFVAKPKISQQFLENLTSFQNEMKAKGLPYSTKVIEQKEVLSSPELESVFGEGYSSYIFIKRLRYIKDNPVVVVSTYIPKQLAPDLINADLTNASLYETLQLNYNLKIQRAQRVMEAVVASDEDAKWLELEKVSAAMFIKTTGFLEDNRIFEYSLARYRGDLTNFTVNLSI